MQAQVLQVQSRRLYTCTTAEIFCWHQWQYLLIVKWFVRYLLSWISCFFVVFRCLCCRCRKFVHFKTISEIEMGSKIKRWTGLFMGWRGMWLSWIVARRWRDNKVGRLFGVILRSPWYCLILFSVLHQFNSADHPIPRQKVCSFSLLYRPFYCWKVSWYFCMFFNSFRIVNNQATFWHRWVCTLSRFWASVTVW